MKLKLLIIGFIFLFTGCYNYRELNDLAIISAVGIDKNGDQYEMAIQFLNTQKDGSDTNNASNEPKFTVYTTTGKTIHECFRNIILVSPKRLYANHTQLLVIGEDLAREGIADTIDLLFRDSESRKQFLVVISKNSSSKEILETLTPIKSLNAEKIVDSIIDESNYYGISKKVTFEELINTYIDDNEEISLPSIEIIGNPIEGESETNLEESSPDTILTLAPLAIFKGDKMIDFLAKDESIAVHFVNNNIKNTIINYECADKKYLSIELIDSKTKREIDTDNNEIKITIASNANITEVNCDIDLEKADIIAGIEKGIEEEMDNNIINAINNIIKKYNSDIFFFKDSYYKKNPKKFKEINNDNFLNIIKIDVKTNITLLEKGNLLKVVEHE